MNKRSGKNSKQNILEAAQRAFTEYGYGGASMRMISATAGISVGGLYLYFHNKEELCLTLLKTRLDHLSRILRKEIAGLDDPVTAISQFITINIEYARTHREIILMQTREQGFAFGIDLKQNFFRKQRGLIRDIIARGIATGCFPACNVEEVAKIIMGLLRGFVFSIVVDSENLFQSEECTRLVLHGLMGKGGDTMAGTPEREGREALTGICTGEDKATTEGLT